MYGQLKEAREMVYLESARPQFLNTLNLCTAHVRDALLFTHLPLYIYTLRRCQPKVSDLCDKILGQWHRNLRVTYRDNALAGHKKLL